jgi:hypothetical protein
MTSYLTSSFVKTVIDGGTISSERIKYIDDRDLVMYLKNFDADLAKYAMKTYILNLKEVQLYIFMKEKWSMEKIVKKPAVIKLFSILKGIANDSVVTKCMFRTDKMKEHEVMMEAKNKKTAERFISQLSNRDR